MIGRGEMAFMADMIRAEPPMIRARLAVRFGKGIARRNPRFKPDLWAQACEVARPEEVVKKILAERGMS